MLAFCGKAETVDWEQRILEGLNPEQIQAVKHDKGPLLVASVAGSGKTTCLVRRVAYLTTVRDVNPSRILAASFSGDAAAELNKRLEETIGESNARIGTLHSIARQIWLNEKPQFQNWQLDDLDWYRSHIKQAVGFRGLNLPKADVTKISLFITLCKANLLRCDNDTTPIFADQFVAHNHNFMSPGRLVQTYQYAEMRREEASQYTFDDMMLEGAALLLSDEDIRTKWARNWDYVLIDEGQDLNLCQIATCECLARDHQNFMIIGDPAQTIYGFRGAFPEKLLNFEDEWSATVINMHRNYRSGHNIIALANNVLDSMKEANRLPVSMTAEMLHAGDIHLEQMDNFDHEGASVGETIAGLIETGETRNSILVIYRTNTQSRAIEEYLIHHQIPYRILGGGSFYERREIRALLNYLRAAEGRATPEEVSNTLQAPFRFMSADHLGVVRNAIHSFRLRHGQAPLGFAEMAASIADNHIRHQKQRHAMTDWGQLLTQLVHAIHHGHMIEANWKPERTDDPFFLLSHIAEETDYFSWLENEEGEESTDNNRASNAREFIRSTQRFASVTELLTYVGETIAAARDQARNATPDKITLASIHKAKGLEFQTVFLIGANEKIIPHYRTQDMEEERRLFYVAVTRAKERLLISHVTTACTSRGILSMTPSRFSVRRPTPGRAGIISPTKPLQ